MKLTERVFMLALIKANYRRRMFWFFLSVVMMIICSSVLYFRTSIDAIIVIVSGFTLIADVIIFTIFYIEFDGFPWVTKRREIIALDQGRSLNFEELLSSVPLGKYFN